MVNFYNNTHASSTFYPNTRAAIGEVDFREEMYDMLYTKKRGADIVYRRAIIENGVPKKCECTKHNRSGEADRDIACSLCEGMGYYFKDYIVKSYINHSQAYAIYKKIKSIGESQVEYKTAYFEWNFLHRLTGDETSIPNRFDKIIQLNKDLAGSIASPSTAREMYDILSVEPYRLDNSGRIEYYRIRIISVVDKSFLV